MTVAYTSFAYGTPDGSFKSSSDYGIICANPSDGLFQETFVSDQTIVEVTIPGRSKPYYQDTTTSPLSFPLKLWLSDPSIFVDNSTADFDLNKLEEIARWLTPSYYQPFYFEDNPDKIFYCKPNQSTQIVHDGLKNGGYITLTMRCNDSYAYSPVFVTEEYDLSNNPINGTEIVLSNRGKSDVGFEMWITKVGDGKVTITNKSNQEQLFEIDNILNGEQLYIDHEEEVIESDSVGRYLYDDMVGDWLSLAYGKNTILVEGNCKIQFRYQNKLINGV